MFFQAVGVVHFRKESGLDASLSANLSRQTIIEALLITTSPAICKTLDSVKLKELAEEYLSDLETPTLP